MHNRKLATLLGKFQPWNKENHQVLKKLILQGYQPVFFLDNCNAKRDIKLNPLNFEERKEIINTACEQLMYSDGSNVEPLYFSLYNFQNINSEAEYLISLLKDAKIKPEDLTLFCTAKDVELENSNLLKILQLLTIKKIILEDIEENKEDFSSPEIERTIQKILERERKKNKLFDKNLHSSSEQGFTEVFAHERRIRDAHLYKKRYDPDFHKTVFLMGADGSLGLPIIESLLKNGHNLVIASPFNSIQFQDSVLKISKNFPNTEIYFEVCDLTNPQTTDVDYWVNMFSNKHQIDAVINMAGIIQERPENDVTFYNINFRPINPMAQACVKTNIDRYIYFSTITARSEEANINAISGEKLTYAGSKRKAEIELDKFSHKLNWISVRPITVFNPQTPNWGRKMTLPEIANMAFTPILGSGKQTLQPIYIGDLAKVSRLVESPIKGGKILEAVGPKQVRLEKILELLRSPNLNESTFVNITYETAELLGKHYSIGGINNAFIKAMKSRETSTQFIPADDWAIAIGEENSLVSIDEYYGHRENAILASAAVQELARKIASNQQPLQNFLQDKAAQYVDIFWNTFQEYIQNIDSPTERRKLSNIIFTILNHLEQNNTIQTEPSNYIDLYAG